MVNAVVQILDSLDDPARGDRTDGQLLDLFVRLHDEEAFAAVVRRHGPMVLGVCRRVLRNSADAEDAFQACFLVLAQRAASINTRPQLAQWLYGVAFNTARKLRHLNARRASRESSLEQVAEPTANTLDDRTELLAVLDEELNQLPERYRAVVVLCDLEGLTRREAAKALACPEGTVAGRLARPRDMLAARLAARGLVPTAGLLATVLTGRTALAISPATVTSVVRVVSVDGLAHAAARGVISPRVAATTEGVLRNMFATKLRTIATIVLCCGVALASTLGAIHFVNAQPTPEKPTAGMSEKPAPEKVVPGDPGKKALTVIPLKKLDPAATAKAIADEYRGKDITVAPLVADKALLIYASAQLTSDIELSIIRLGEDERKVARVIKLKAGVKAEDVARQWSKSYPDITFVPVHAEGAVLAYGNRLTLKILRSFSDEFVPRGTSGSVKPATEPKKFAFRFKDAPWDDVLDWYAKQSGLTLITTVKPTGRFTVQPPAGREFTLSEITDLLNEALTQQKYILIRRHLTFFIHSADEKIDPTMIPRLELSELADRGKTEIVQVILPFKSVVAADVSKELQKVLTPFGMMVVMDKANVIVLQDTVGNIERIRKTLQALEPIAPRAPLAAPPIVKTISVTKGKPEEICALVAKTFGTAQCVPLPQQKQILVIATPDEQERIAKFVRELEEQPQRQNPVAPQKTYSLKLENAPWKDVLAWYAHESGLTRTGDELPTGTVTLITKPDQKLTLAELTDLINEALIQQKWILIRQEKTFTVVPADEKVDPRLVPRVRVSELDKRGRTELVEITMKPAGLDATNLLDLVRKMIGPFGGAESYKSNLLVIRDTVGNLQRIVKTIRELEEAEAKKKSGRG